MTRRVPKLAAIIGIATVYVAAARLGLGLAIVHPYATAVWPPSGIALAALLIYGRSVWPGIYIGAFIANLTNGGAATPQTIVVAAAIASGNTVEALAGGWLTQRFAGGLSAFDRASGVFRFSALAAGGSTLISASVGVFTLIMAGSVPPPQPPAHLLSRG